MRFAALLAFAIVACGCAGRFDEARIAGAPYRASMSAPAQAVAPTPIGVDCVSLDRGRIIYHGGAVLFGAAGLSGTLAAIPTNDDTKLRNGLLIGSAVSAAIGVGSEAIAQGLGNEWVKYCSGP